jgi:hypothetical protein
MQSLPNVLIVGTVPYNESTQARALMSYFQLWSLKKENAAQFFSDPREPKSGFCKTFYQLTDEMILDKILHRGKTDLGIVFERTEIERCPKQTDKECTKKNRYGFLKKLKNFKGPFEKLLRGHLWKKRFWCNSKFLNWADDFKPDVIYCCFSDDFFILQISLFLSQRYSIPIIVQIGDDYIFNGHFSLNPFYWFYRCKYLRLAKKIFSKCGGALFSSSKIQAKYNGAVPGESKVIYISSNVVAADISNGNASNLSKTILYVGSVSLGRWKSIIEVGEALSSFGSDYVVDVYTSDNDEKINKKLSVAKGIAFHGPIPYSEVSEKMASCSALLITESFSKHDLISTAYSLSTKVADCLASGKPVFAYGPSEAGFMDYLLSEDCACCCLNKEQLHDKLKICLFDQNYRDKLCNNELNVFKKNHSYDRNSTLFLSLLHEILKKDD